MRILRDTSLSVHYPMVVKLIPFILKSVGSTRSVPLLKYIMPPLLR